jgi:hypothetical protein
MPQAKRGKAEMPLSDRATRQLPAASKHNLVLVPAKFTQTERKKPFFAGQESARLEGFLVDQGVGLTRSDTTGVNAHGKVAQELVRTLHVGDVQGIGVGEHGEPVSFTQSLQERAILYRLRIKRAIPHFHELLEAEFAAEPSCKVKMPVPR